MQWQPITTAPTDGTPFIATNKQKARDPTGPILRASQEFKAHTWEQWIGGKWHAAVFNKPKLWRPATDRDLQEAGIIR